MSLAGTIQTKGAAVTFSLTTMTFDATTETSTPTTTTVAGYAMEVDGDLEEYKAAEVIASQAKTLLFVPTTSGEVPLVESTLTWASETFATKSVKSLGLAGTAQASRVMVSK
jgi:hypothetical protein